MARTKKELISQYLRLFLVITDVIIAVSDLNDHKAHLMKCVMSSMCSIVVTGCLLSFCVDFSFNQFYHITRLECKFEERFCTLEARFSLPHSYDTVVNLGWSAVCGRAQTFVYFLAVHPASACV